MRDPGDSFFSDEEAEFIHVDQQNKSVIDEMLARGSKDKLAISVLDSGLGINSGDQLSLFKMFSCLKNNRELNTQGIGLGLFICKHIVQEFGGQVTVKSRPSKGSRFSFWFELEEPERPGEEPERGQIVERRHQVSIQRSLYNYNTQKILVVDDEAFNITAILGLMKALKMNNISTTVDTCQDGQETV